MTSRRGIAPEHYTTGGIPPEQRHERWKERGWPSVAALFESTPIGEFSTMADTVVIGGMIISYSVGSARLLERTPEGIAEDGIDVLGAGILLEGEMQGTAGDRKFAAGAGEILLLDMSQPVTMTMTSARSVQLAISRAEADTHLGSIAALHGSVIGQAASALLYGHLIRLSEGLRLIREEDGPRMARTLLDLLAIAVNASPAPTPALEAVSGGSITAQRARAEIRQNLGSSSLNVTWLCRRLGVSRSTLHRLFENEGGVQSFIRNSRLDAVRLALMDSHNEERMGDLADRFGFSDGAHLSRLFRARFGETPSQCRARVRAGERGRGTAELLR